MTMLVTGLNPVIADSLSNLLQMDVKKSSVADTVDVTFYTTGEASNSVVTRKSNNRYVVLLPNTSSNASVAPSFSSVKDLITDIDVKHVDDGIGGYTKVTFGTTKPINIKTHMKKTNPLTQAQKDSQAIIAKNTAAAAVSTPQLKAQNAQPASKETAKSSTTTTTQAKPAVQTQKTSTPKVVPVSTPKVQTAPVKPKQEAAKSKVEPKVQQKSVQPKVEPKVVVKSQPKVEKVAVQSNSYVPKMKFDENGKRIIDLEPRVSHNIVVEQPKNIVNSDSIFNVSENSSQVSNTLISEDTAIETPVEKSKKSFNFMPLWILLAGGSTAVLGFLYLMYDAKAHADEKDQTRLQSFFNLSSQNVARRRKRDYDDIANNKNLSWQEKYKLYVEKEEKTKTNETESPMTFVTDMSGEKKAIVTPEQNSNNIDSSSAKKSYKEMVREKMQVRISQMEHALAQVSTLNEEKSVINEVKSEDDAIVNKISEIKLKSFSKQISLKETQRSLSTDDIRNSRNKTYKEGKFVKLRNSALSISQRNSSASSLGASDIVEIGNKFLSNNGEVKMDKEKENYLVSSLGEYLSILDSESSSTATISKSSVADSLAQVKSSTHTMSSSAVSNPISRASNSSNYLNGLIVKSGFNIDSEKGIYLVNVDGVSALVGRIQENIFMLKKFDHVIDKPIQVRQDKLP